MLNQQLEPGTSLFSSKIFNLVASLANWTKTNTDCAFHWVYLYLQQHSSSKLVTKCFWFVCFVMQRANRTIQTRRWTFRHECSERTKHVYLSKNSCGSTDSSCLVCLNCRTIQCLELWQPATVACDLIWQIFTSCFVVCPRVAPVIFPVLINGSI